MAIVFYESIPGDLARPVNGQQHLLTLAELIQTIGGAHVPIDPGRSAAETELLLESQLRNMQVTRYTPILEPGAPVNHTNSLEDEMDAEHAYFLEVPATQRTKMVLARAIERNDRLDKGEDLITAWKKSLVSLQARGDHLRPPPPA